MKKKLLALATILYINSSYAQVGINTSEPKSTLDLVAKTTAGTTPEGILIPRISKQKAYDMAPDADITNTVKNPVANSTLVYIDNMNFTETSVGAKSTDNITSQGFYFYQESSKRWQALSPTSKASFYYSPTILLPTSPTDARILDASNTNFSINGEVYSVSIYNIFKGQFNSPVAVSSGNLGEFVKTATGYSYYVTYYDTTVFTNVTIDDNGLLQYKVVPNSIIRNGSFMNIVLKEN